jgi:UPF0755 protein
VKKIVISIFIVAILVGAYTAYRAYDIIYAPNVPKYLDEEHLYIPTGATYDSLFAILKRENFLTDPESFDTVAEWMKFKKRALSPGRYRIIGGWSNRTLIQHIRSGNQDPVSVTFNNVRTIEELAGKVATYIEPDSLDILISMTREPWLRSLGYTRENALSMYIPNTYELYWNTTVDAFLHRMNRENQKFWESNNRLEKAKSLHLTPAEVYTLASIVEKETRLASEKRRIAGVYLNRIKKGMLLQADPTVVFAIGDFTLRRVLNKHLAYDSPYNTYLHKGIPPGPICMPEIGTIDAVLNAEQHNFIFFCAEPGYSGAHAFAETLPGHMANARKYQKWLHENQIK